jgi:hypothetical protein
MRYYYVQKRAYEQAGYDQRWEKREIPPSPHFYNVIKTFEMRAYQLLEELRSERPGDQNPVIEREWDGKIGFLPEGGFASEYEIAEMTVPYSLDVLSNPVIAIQTYQVSQVYHQPSGDEGYWGETQGPTLVSKEAKHLPNCQSAEGLVESIINTLWPIIKESVEAEPAKFNRTTVHECHPLIGSALYRRLREKRLIGSPDPLSAWAYKMEKEGGLLPPYEGSVRTLRGEIAAINRERK